MNYKKVIFGIIGAAAAWYACGAEIKIVEHPDVPSKGDDEVEHREIRLKTIFGINEEILADTNRFPVSSDRRHEVDLPDGMAGFKTAKFSLAANAGKFGILKIEMRKILSAEAGDDDLRREFKSAVDMVGKLLDVELKCPELRDIDEWRGCWGEVTASPGLRLSSQLRIEVADDYSVTIEAKDATYARRNGSWHIVANATVGVEVRNDDAKLIQLSPHIMLIPLRQHVLRKKHMLRKEKKPVAIAQEIAFGADLSNQLSESTKEAAERRNGTRCGECRIKRLLKKAESGDVDAPKKMQKELEGKQ